jgi:hypothetical protein
MSVPTAAQPTGPKHAGGWQKIGAGVRRRWCVQGDAAVS